MPEHKYAVSFDGIIINVYSAFTANDAIELALEDCVDIEFDGNRYQVDFCDGKLFLYLTKEPKKKDFFNLFHAHRTDITPTGPLYNVYFNGEFVTKITESLITSGMCIFDHFPYEVRKGMLVLQTSKGKDIISFPDSGGTRTVLRTLEGMVSYEIDASSV